MRRSHLGATRHAMEQQHASTSALPETAPRGATGARHASDSPHAVRPPTDDVDRRALQHARAIIDALFGPSPMRPMHVRYWDDSIERGRTDSKFTLRLNRRGALRRMLLPPSELSIV